MAAPEHVVFVMKQEFGDSGGSAADQSPYPRPIEVGEDAPAVRGFFLQASGATRATHDELVYITRDVSNNMIFRDDVVQEEIPLSAFLRVVPTEVGQVLYSADGSTFSVAMPITSSDGWLANKDGELLIEG